MNPKDTRLIEAGFPCHQVGAETRRERGAATAPLTARPMGTPSADSQPHRMIQSFVRPDGSRV